MQQFLKSAARVAWARIISAQLLKEFLFAVDYASTALDASFRREALPPLTCFLETRIGRGVLWAYARHTSINMAALTGGARMIAVPRYLFCGLTSKLTGGFPAAAMSRSLLNR